MKKRLNKAPVFCGRSFFNCAIMVFFVLGLFAIWIPRFPAMQDYPQHLFMAYVVSSYGEPALNWSEYFQVDLSVRPYSLFYYFVAILSKVINIEISGKIFISISLLLTSSFIYVRNLKNKYEENSWSLLILFPLFFSQIHYLGFLNYLISIPILFISLELHQKIQEKFSLKLFSAYAFFLSLLFAAHPYSVLVYIVLAIAISLSHGRKKMWKRLFAPFFMLVVFSIWYGLAFEASTMLPSHGLRIQWWPSFSVLQYFFLPFFGMQANEGACFLSIVLWSTIVLIFASSSFRNSTSTERNRTAKYLLLATLAGYVFMPFWLGDYSYFNLRMSIICYFAIAMAFENISIDRRASSLLLGAIFSIMILTISKNISISKDIESLIPVFHEMEGNEIVMPIYYESSSSELDDNYFDDFFTHSHFYYHIENGGGANPRLFNSSMNPIKLVVDLSFPELKEQPSFYRYLLVRGDVPMEENYFATHQISMESGRWTLFEKSKNEDW